MERLYPQVWMALPKETKLHLIKVFGIVRTGVTDVRDQEVVSDGFTSDDLAVVTLDKMNEYIGSLENFTRAWELTLAKVHSELNPPMGEIFGAENGGMAIRPVEESPVVAEPTPEEPLIAPEAPVAPEPVADEAVKPFCDSCGAPREPHFRKCPNYTGPVNPNA